MNITPKKTNFHYRFRFGVQVFPVDINTPYTMCIELFNRDYITWSRTHIFIEGLGIWLRNHDTVKYQHHYDSNNDLYYHRTIINFNRTSISGPSQILYTIHYDNRGGDLDTYPDQFKDQLYVVAYGCKGYFNNIDSLVYDKHEAYEIDKTKMKMLVSLDLNNKKIINISNDSDVTKINLYGMVDKRRFFTAFTMPIEFNKVRIVNIKLLNTIKTRLKKDVINFYITSSSIIKYPFTFPGHPAYIYIQINKFFNVIHYIKLVNTVDIPFQITYDVFY